MSDQAANATQNYKYVLDRYDKTIAFYWRRGAFNRNFYRQARYLTVIFGALVTLTSSLTSAEFVRSSALVAFLFAVGTPLLAACLAILGGLSQTFQWGASWSEMALTAERLQKERDRIQVTPAEKLDAVKELDLLNELVLKETQGFFERALGSQRTVVGSGAGEPPAHK